MAILWIIVIGLIAGLLARFLVPGPDPMGLLATIVLGIVGSFVGGFIKALFGLGGITDLNTAGLLMSIVGAIVVLLIYRMVKARA
ncbi:MAG: GlsB/YeaQ/YmgE family stress response membrane protein [Acidimicrobiia bacterium]